MSSPATSTLSLDDDFTIRSLTSKDIPRICELHSTLLPGAKYPASFFRHTLLLSDRLCLVAHPTSDPSQVIAFVTASIQDTHPVGQLAHKGENQPKVHVMTLGVLPEYQRKGLARRLVQDSVRKLVGINDHLRGFTDATATTTAEDEALNHAKLSAHVCTTNQNACRFYERLGMCAQDVVHDVYRRSAAGDRDAYLFTGVY